MYRFPISTTVGDGGNTYQKYEKAADCTNFPSCFWSFIHGAQAGRSGFGRPNISLSANILRKVFLRIKKICVLLRLELIVRFYTLTF